MDAQVNYGNLQTTGSINKVISASLQTDHKALESTGVKYWREHLYIEHEEVELVTTQSLHPYSNVHDTGNNLNVTKEER